MISKEKIKYIAKLSRIHLTKKDIKKYQNRIEEILGYIKKIKKADTKNSKPFKGVVDSFDLRKDKAYKKEGALTKKLVDQAPEKKDNLIKTKPIFKK